jgi:hypothetical protein
MPRRDVWMASVGLLCAAACTQEQQNVFRHDIQNWTGTNGVLEIYSGEKAVRRFLKVDKLSTAHGSAEHDEVRPYRFGYGVLDENLNGVADSEERRVYFEISAYATNYVFFESPR